MQTEQTQRRQIHWQKTRFLTFVVLLVWFVFSCIVPWFADDLNAYSFLGFQLGYYFLVQGSLAIFVALIVLHNIGQNNIDDQYGSGQ